MLKYEVVKRVIATDEDIQKNGLSRFFNFKIPNFIAYKIVVGLYIFYITQEVYEQGVKEGLIEPISKEIPLLLYKTMRLSRGQVINHRLPYALKHSTIPYLKQELIRANEELKIVHLRVYETDWFKKGQIRIIPKLTFKEDIKVDLGKRIVIFKNSASISDARYLSVLNQVSTYEDFLDMLACELDREYMNSRNLYDKFREVKFYEVDYWIQRSKKFEFNFE